MDEIKIFEKYADEYDIWFEKNNYIYKSEIKALGKFIPKCGRGLEVGVGTGRFAVPLGIKIGIEPAKKMADIARNRGIKVENALAENIPYDNESFDFVLLMTTICFLKNPVVALKEIRRVLIPNGLIIIGMVDKNSFLGKLYEKKRLISKFYKYATIYSTEQVLEWLNELNFGNFKICQTIFKKLEDIKAIEPVKDGHGSGGFVVISAQKNPEL
ncbi:MAG: class I SAM-dependent methyltransferase [Candidatus Helarchaeota archaeon]